MRGNIEVVGANNQEECLLSDRTTIFPHTKTLVDLTAFVNIGSFSRDIFARDEYNADVDDARSDRFSGFRVLGLCQLQFLLEIDQATGIDKKANSPSPLFAIFRHFSPFFAIAPPPPPCEIREPVEQKGSW